MKQKFLALVLVLSLILVGCISENAPREEHVVSTTIIPSSTLLPTETLTPTPSESKTPVPTPTRYLTAFPTLSGEETYRLLYKAKFKCDIPCWWGIIPGRSTWTETKQFIEQFSTYSFGFDKVNLETNITKSIPSDTYMWYVLNPIPNSDASTSLFIEVENNIVTGIQASGELVWYFFPVHKILEEYGQPDEILFSSNQYDIVARRYYASVYLVYKDKHVLAKYEYSGPVVENLVNLCMLEYGERFMDLWASDTQLNVDLSNLKSLSDFSRLTSDTFYDRFKDQNNKCLQISKDAWK